WLEIIRQVLRAEYDLVVVGTPDAGGLRRALFGSTAETLLHQCPCPVWVTKPGSGPHPTHILVASDLTPLADQALGLAVALAPVPGAAVHVLPVAAYPRCRGGSTTLPEERPGANHGQTRAAAGQALHAQLKRVGSPASAADVHIHLADGTGVPDDAILQFVRD